MQVLPFRPLFSRAPSDRDPSFVVEGYERLAQPFREALQVLIPAPGEASLRTRLTLNAHLLDGAASVPVHWEVARHGSFRELERYGLLLAQPHTGYAIHVPLTGLEPGRRYWIRLWAGGHWSRAARLSHDAGKW